LSFLRGKIIEGGKTMAKKKYDEESEDGFSDFDEEEEKYSDYDY